MVFPKVLGSHRCDIGRVRGASFQGTFSVPTDGLAMGLRRLHQSGPGLRRRLHQAYGAGLQATAGHRAGGGSSARSGSSGGERYGRTAVRSTALGRGRAEFFAGGNPEAALREDEDYDWDGGEENGPELEDQEGGHEEEEDDEDEDAGILARSVVQVRTLHRVPNFSRPWEEGHDAESSSSGFVVAAEVVSEPGAPPRRQLLLMTTAGAVEHARKVEVCRAADDATPYPASVAAVCLDLDVALLRVDDPRFWMPYDEDGDDDDDDGGGGRHRPGRGGRGRQAQDGSIAAAAAATAAAAGGWPESGSGSGVVPVQLDRGLPHLRKPVVVAGFPLGGGSLCVTSGVVSRIEVLEYSHSGRGLLALQVDAPLNNGGWGGPALCPTSGRCVGMAFQKFASQTWMERYDEAAAEVYGGDGGEDDEGGGGGSGDGEGGGSDDGEGGGHGQDYDEDAENIGYLVPAQLLQLVLDDYSRALSHRHASTSAPSASSPSAGARGSNSGSVSKRGARGARPAAAAAAAGAAAGETRGSAAPPPLYLDGRPRLGLRYQRMESPALRRSLGLAAGQSGILVTGVDPTGSAAGLVQVHDVLLAVGDRKVANDGTTLLRPGQRVLFGHWAAVANVGDPLTVTVLRGGERAELTLRLRGAGAPFLPVSLGPGRRPQYLVVGPLVFAAFSLPYWYELMAGQQQQASDRAARRRLHSGLVPVLGALEWGLPTEDDGEEVVLLTEVLEYGSAGGDDGEAGGKEEGEEEGEEADGGGGGGGVASEAAAWSQLLQSPGRLATVNGQRVRNLAQLAAVVIQASAASAAAAADGGGDGAEGDPQRFLRLCLEPGPRQAAGDADGGAASSASGGSCSGAAPADGSPSPSPSPSPSSGTSAAGRLVVLDAARLAGDTRAVLGHHSMAAAMSGDMRRRLSSNWPFEASHQAHGASRQRRQQGRRVALSGRR